MGLLLQDILQFFESNKQSVEVNPADCVVAGCDCLLVSEVKLCIVLHYLTRVYKEIMPNPPPDFRVIHLWEDAWRKSPEIVIARLRSAMGISRRLPARVMQVRRIDKLTADEFLNAHHLQGSPAAKFKYGLFLPKKYYRLVKNPALLDQTTNETLVAVATFGGAKTYVRQHQKSRSIELIRFANRSAFTVIGGLNKLLRILEKEQQPNDIMTYVDADWSDGKSFTKLGFERTEKTAPMTIYVDKRTLNRHTTVLPSTTMESYYQIKNSGSWKLIKLLGIPPVRATT